MTSTLKTCVQQSQFHVGLQGYSGGFGLQCERALYISTRMRLQSSWGCAGLAVERPGLALAVHATIVHLGTLPALMPPANQAAGATLGRMAPQEAPQLLCNLQACSTT